ncbi:PIH1 domain-containing protein 1 [Blattella germanica]|nr:PIH1 domain-containing protein 1 [Blattella germanica]
MSVCFYQESICVKTRTAAGEKVFINICQTPEIPAPDDITEEQLVQIWSSEEHSSFRVPMSIGEAHLEDDKSGNPALVYDVAINPEFFKKVHNSVLFKKFLLTVVIEGLQDKYSIELETEGYVILKNRKAMGELQHHTVRQGDKEKKPTGPLIEEVYPPMQLPTSEPPYRIRSEPPQAETPEYLLAEKLRRGLGETSSKDVALDVGEDRISLESPGHIGHQGYKLDVFIPYNVNQEECSASFNIDTKVSSY